MRSLWVLTLTLLFFASTVHCATNEAVEAKKFISDASKRYFNLYDKIAQETYTLNDDEDFDSVFKKFETVKQIANELVEISEEANEFDQSRIQDPETKQALHHLHTAGDLFVLGEEYFSSVVTTFVALHSLATDKDNEPYMSGINIPNYDGEPLAYFPDIENIFKKSNDPEELKYYWETWRDKNLVWSSVNFFTIIESLQKAANILDIPVLEFWYRYYNNKDFLKEMEKVMEEIKPSYQQLHAFIRKELHTKYGSEVVNANGPIPDHLFEQVRAQVWNEGSVIEKYFPYGELPPYNDFVKHFDAKEMINEAERFYTSLGFEPLDDTFKNEQLKEQSDEANRGDCRADIFDLTPHVYMKYCHKVSFRKFLQNHGYIGQVYYAKEKKNLPAYYFNSYDLEYPIGEAVILSASTPKHLAAIGLAKNFNFEEKTLMNRLFRMGIHAMLNIPLFFVHTKVVNDLLNGSVDMETVNKHYWRLMEKYVGVEPPLDRTEGAIDFPYKFYLDIEQNHQTKKFVSEILGYQFYRAFCKKAGTTAPLHNCDFYGNLSIGSQMKQMMALGSSKSWNEVIAKVLPDNHNLSGEALLEYYKPILDWIKKQNVDTKVKIGWNASQKTIV